MEILIRTLQLKENKEILCNKVNHVLSISIRISRLHCKKNSTVKKTSNCSCQNLYQKYYSDEVFIESTFYTHQMRDMYVTSNYVNIPIYLNY